MAYSNEGPFILTSGEALSAHRLVKISSGEAVYCDAGEEPIGLTVEAVADATPVAIQPLNGNLQQVTTALLIATGTAIYPAADGKVSSTAAGGKQLGITFSASTAANGIVPAIIWGPRGGNDMLSTRGGNIEFFDDFFAYDGTATVGGYLVAGTGAGTVAAIDGVGGVLSIASGGTDNNEAYASSVTECFKFAASKPLFFEAKLNLTEAATDDANWIIGLSDVVDATALTDNGAGPPASYDGAVFFKVDGTMTIQFETSNAATQVTDANVGTFVSATDYKVGFFFDPGDGTTGSITPYVDGVADAAQAITLAGLAEMHVLMGVKSGGANAETLLVDYVHVVGVR